jgi:hypothetical protein
MPNEILDPALDYIAAANLPSGALATEDWLPASMQARAVADALSTHSRIHPYSKSKVSIGNGTQYFDLSELQTWDDNHSGVVAVEFPYTSATIGQNVLHTEAWEVLEHPVDRKVLRFFEDTPAASEEFLVRFTSEYAEGDISPAHVGPVAKLAASNMALALAARTSSHKEATVGGSWNASGARTAYAELARTLRSEAMKDLGVGGENGNGTDVGAACAIQAIDRDQLTTHGYGRLTRPRRRI